MSARIPIPATVPEYSDEWFTLTTLGGLTPPRFWPALSVPAGGPGDDSHLGGKRHDPDLAARIRSWLIDYAPGDSLLIIGPTGTGKTYLGYRILRHLVNRYVLDHQNIIRAKFDVNVIGEDALMKGRRASGSIDSVTFEYQFLRPSFLMIDDLGVAKGSEYAEAEMFSLINHRYENLLTTIFTSNVSVLDLGERIGERISDRLNGMCSVIVLDGESLRDDEVNPNSVVVRD